MSSSAFLNLDVSLIILLQSFGDIDNVVVGVGPAIPLYFSFFYTKQEMGLRMAYWFGFAAVAGAFGGLVAFGVQQAHSHVANWKILFIIEVGLSQRSDYFIIDDALSGNSSSSSRCHLSFLPSRPARVDKLSHQRGT